MNRALIESYIMAGDMVGLAKNKPIGLNISEMFIDVINTAHGSDLDLMIGNCLHLYRIQGTQGFYGAMCPETDVDYRARAILIAPHLDKRHYETDGIYSYKVDWTNTSCMHDWKSYYGLMESYEYCSKCNERNK